MNAAVLMVNTRQGRQYMMVYPTSYSRMHRTKSGHPQVHYMNNPSMYTQLSAPPSDQLQYLPILSTLFIASYSSLYKKNQHNYTIERSKIR
ncbi:P2 [Cnidium virus 1]|uniref:P2 n=1 Tax=Cnidium virus 1 TaxID=2903266 RepID=A0A8K1XTF1_9RHAB|nr:P2 [Cnidium virus 1]UGY70981.1 P2 [Cnidium virus 1]